MPLNAVVDRLQSGVALHQSGRWADAESIYREILRDEPANADALYLLGTLHYQRNSLGSAVLFLRKAIAAHPRHVEAHNNLGLALESQGKLEEALEVLTRALTFSPHHADAHYNQGNVLRGLGRHEEAVAAYRNALKQRARWAEALDNMGLSLRALGQMNEARQAFERALAARPEHASAHNNLGALHKDNGDYARAVDEFRHATKLDPSSAIAWSNLGIAQAHLGELASAEANCRRALELAPQSPIANNNLGLVLFLSGREEEALVPFQQACALSPDFADARHNLASTYFRLGDLEQAVANYQEALRLRPSTSAWKNLGAVLEQGCLWEEARVAFMEASRSVGADPLLELRVQIVCPTVHSSIREIAAYSAALDAELDRWGERPIKRRPEEFFDLDIRPNFAWQFLDSGDRTRREKLARILEPSFPSDSPPPRNEGKPAVGFFLPAGHEVAFLRSIGGFFPIFQKDDWRPVVICSRASLDKLAKSPCMEGVERLVIPKELSGAYDAIRSAEFDIIYYFEIATGPLNYILPMMRPAPYQVTSWGIQVTSGLAAIDTYLSSQWIEGPEADAHYTEKLVRLETMLSYQQYPEVFENISDRAVFGISNDAHVYLCAQQLGKFHPDFDSILQSILDRDPAGLLVVTESSFPAETQALRARWQKLGSFLDRVCFLPKQKGANYAGLFQAADVVLDPIHFGGVNTTYDAMAAGKATVTWPSPFNKGRYTFGCFQRMGMSDTVAASAEEYIRIAVQLGTEPDLRIAIERKIAERRDVLFECRQSAVELENWLRETVERGRRG